MSREKELLKNTVIVFIGKLFTQFISFLLIPLYTFCLNTKEYGYIDLIQTYIMIIVPTLILRFDSAIFRYLIDCRKKQNEKKEVISSTIFILFLQILFFILVSIILLLIFDIKYIEMIIFNIIVLSISNIMLQICRGNGNMTNYAISSIICGISSTLLNVLFIAILKLDASYILAASTIGNLLCIIYIIITEKVYNDFSRKSINKSKLKDMLHYSIPLIPDGLSWWAVIASDRTIISAFLGAASNGIYAISCKFSNILATFFTVFNLTWHESASVHINDKDRDVFFSGIFDTTLKLFSTVCLGVLVCVPFAYKIMVGAEYIESYIYIPVILLGNLFNSMANVTGGIYIAKKETKKVAKTTLLGAIINILINLLLVSKFGLWAAAVSTAISYMVISVYRYIDVNREIKLRINKKITFIIMVQFIVSTFIYYINNIYLNIVNFLIVIIFAIITNGELIKKILKGKIRRFS